MPFAGLGTISISRFQPSTVPMIWPDVAPHLFEAVSALLRQWWQVFDLVVVEGRHPRAGAPEFLVVAFHGAVRVEVVLDHGEPGAPGCPDGLPDLVDLLVSTRFSVECIREAADHEVAQRQPGGFQLLHAGTQVGLLPGDPPGAAEDVIDAELLHPPHRGGIRARERQADLGRIGALGRRARHRRGGRQRGR